MLAPAVAALAATTMAVPAHAVETSFATWTGLGLSFVASNPGTSGGSLTLTDSSAIVFNFLQTTSSTAVSNISANMVFTASSSNTNFNSTLAGFGIADQTLFSGSLSIISTQAFTVGKTTFAAGSNLLTATFSNATFLGVLGQQNAGLTADSSTGTLIYTSDYLSFDNTVSRDFSFSFGAINPVLTAGTISGVPAYIQSFTSTPTGTFASDPVPLSKAVVPEPATWAMMLVGMGAIGFSLRGVTRRKLLAA